MDHFEKLFRKIRADERVVLSLIVEKLVAGDMNGLQVKKLAGSDFYRLRKGVFRVIFHYKDAVPVIDSIRIRNEKTYRRF